MTNSIGPNQLSFLNNFSSSSYSRADSKQSVSSNPTRTLQEQQSELLQGLKTSDVIHLNSLNVDSRPPVNILEDDNSFRKTLRGRRKGLILNDSELSSRIDNILSRLSEEQGIDLIDMGLMEHESFIKYAEQLSDKDLKNLVSTGAALQTNGTDSRYHALSGEMELKNLIEKLQKMDTKTASMVLERTSQLSMSVPLQLREPLTAYPPGTIPPEIKGHSSANDLHHLVRTINNIDSENLETTTNAIFDNLGKFSQDQQRNLLLVLESEPERGVSFMKQLSGFTKEVQDIAINYMSDLVESIWVNDQGAPEIAPNDLLGPDEWHGRGLDFDVRSESATNEIMNNFVSLLEKYQFSNKQLSEMTSNLNSLDKQEQRTYLDITTIGLDRLLGGNKEKPINLESNQEALITIDRLRSNDSVRHLINESRMGEKRLTPNGHTYYAVKGKADGKLDQKQTIELLVTDAWFNREEPGRASTLATKLSGLEADKRDELVDELQSLNKTGKPLSNYGPDNRDQQFEKFFERTDAIYKSNDLSALLDASDKMEDGQQDDFWQAADFMGYKVNKFVDVVYRASTQEAKLLLDYINNLSEQLNENQKELEEEKALRLACGAIDNFAELNKLH